MTITSPVADRPGSARITREVLARAPGLRTRLGDGAIGRRAALAADPDCSPEVLDILADDRPYVVMAVARNPNSSPDTLARIVAALGRGHQQFMTRHTHLAALSNPQCPPSTLAEMLTGYPQVVLSNPSCPLDLARQAAGSSSGYLRLAAIECHPLPAADLVGMVCDEYDHVALAARVAVLSHDWESVRAAIQAVGKKGRRWFFENLTPGQLRMLAGDPDPWLRRGAARHTSSHELLRRLAGDPNGHVRRAATQRLLQVLAA